MVVANFIDGCWRKVDDRYGQRGVRYKRGETQEYKSLKYHLGLRQPN
jgi:hypothetical protein